MELEIDTTNNKLYVLSEDGGGSFIFLIDLTNLNKTFDILLNGETFAIEVFNDRLYVADTPFSISIINPIDNNIHYLKLDSRILNIVFNNITDLMYTADYDKSISFEYNIYSHSPTGGIINSLLLDVKSITDIEINNNSGIIYVANFKNNTVSVINSTTNSIIEKITVGNSPTELDINPNNNLLYVTNSGDNTVSVINSTTNSVIDTITVGKSPEELAINPNNNLLYVTNSGDNTVSVINSTDNTVIDKIKTNKVSI